MKISTRALNVADVASLLTDTEPYLSCDDCFESIDQFVERTLADPAYDDVAMLAHLRGCPACAEEAATLLELLTEDEPPPAPNAA